MSKIHFAIRNHEFVGHRPGEAAKKAEAEGREISTWNKVIDYLPLKRRTTMEGMLRQLSRERTTTSRSDTAVRLASPVTADANSKQSSVSTSKLEQLPPELLREILSHVPYNTPVTNNRPENLSQTSRTLRGKTIHQTVSKRVAMKLVRQLDGLTKASPETINVFNSILDGIQYKNLHQLADSLPEILGLPVDALKQMYLEPLDVAEVALQLARHLYLVKDNERYSDIFNKLLQVVCAQPASVSQVTALGLLAYKLEGLSQGVDRIDKFDRICNAIINSSHTHDVSLAIQFAARALRELPNGTEKTVVCFDKVTHIIGGLPESEELAIAVYSLVSNFDVLPAHRQENVGRFESIGKIIESLRNTQEKTSSIEKLTERITLLPADNDGRLRGLSMVENLIARIEDATRRKHAISKLINTIAGRDGFEDRKVLDTFRKLSSPESGASIMGPAASHQA